MFRMMIELDEDKVEQSEYDLQTYMWNIERLAKKNADMVRKEDGYYYTTNEENAFSDIMLFIDTFAYAQWFMNVVKQWQMQVKEEEDTDWEDDGDILEEVCKPRGILYC